MAEEEDRWNSSGGEMGSAYLSDAGTKRKRGELAGEPKSSLFSLAIRVANATQLGPEPADEKAQSRNSVEKQNERDQKTKNAVSNQLMDHLVKPSSSSEDFTWPQVNLGSEFDKGRVAPNGLDTSANDGQSFDLNAFLAQCENSPQSDAHSKSTPEASSSCSSSLPSLERGASTCSSSEASNHGAGGANDSRHASFSSNLPQNSGAEGQELDKFWSWILSQGGNEALQQPQSQVQMAAPGTNSSNFLNSDDTLMNNSNYDSFGAGPTLNGGSLSLQRAPSFAISSTPTQGQAQEKNGDSNTPYNFGAANLVATPSAGIPGDWLSGPSLFDFTNELGGNGESQPSAPVDGW